LHQTCPANRKEAASVVRRQTIRTRAGLSNPDHALVLPNRPRACRLALGTPDEFTRYVAALSVEQKRKRNLMKILDQNGL